LLDNVKYEKNVKTGDKNLITVLGGGLRCPSAVVVDCWTLSGVV